MKKELKEFTVFAQQVISFKQVILATDKEDANQQLEDLSSDWDECGELEWEDLPAKTMEGIA